LVQKFDQDRYCRERTGQRIGSSQGITLNIPPGSIREVRPNGPNGSAEEAAAGAGQGQIPVAFDQHRGRLANGGHGHASDIVNDRSQRNFSIPLR
jgi:hypothetical protein